MLHPFKQQHLVVQVHRAEGLPVGPDGVEPDVHVDVCFGGPGNKLSTSKLHGRNPAWGVRQPYICRRVGAAAADGSPTVQHVPAPEPGAGADELFLLREDECLVSNLSIGFRVVASRSGGGSWLSSSSEVTVAQGDLHLGSAHARLTKRLCAGQAPLIHLPLQSPPAGAEGKAAGGASTASLLAPLLSRSHTHQPHDTPTTTPTLTPMVSMQSPGGGMDGKPGGAVVSTMLVTEGEEWQAVDVPGQAKRDSRADGGVDSIKGPAGLLVVSCWLQPTWAEDRGLAAQLPPDLLPCSCLTLGNLPPGGVLHAPVATAYHEPCVVLVRLRLLAVWGLQAGKPVGGDRSRLASGRRGGTGGGEAGATDSEGPVARTARALGMRLQVQGNALVANAAQFLGRLRAHAPPQQQQQQGGDGLESTSTAPSMTPTPILLSRVPSVASQPSGAMSRSASVLRAGEQDGEGRGSSSRGVGTGASIEQQPSRPLMSAGLRFGSFNQQHDASAPGPIPAAGQGEQAVGPLQAGLLRLASSLSLGMDTPGSPVAGHHVLVSSSGAAGITEVTHVLNALEDAGFSVSAAEPIPDFTHCWLKISFAGQEHATSMAPIVAPVSAQGGAMPGVAAAQPGLPDSVVTAPPAAASTAAATRLFGRGASAAWLPDEPPALLASTRPMMEGPATATGAALAGSGTATAAIPTTPPLELELWATKDAKNRGRSIAKFTTSLPRLLAAAGVLHAPEASGAPGSAVRRLADQGMMDPAAWPQGDVLLQGRMEGGAPAAVSLYVDVVDDDARAHVLGLPLRGTHPPRQSAHNCQDKAAEDATPPTSTTRLPDASPRAGAAQEAGPQVQGEGINAPSGACKGSVLASESHQGYGPPGQGFDAQQPVTWVGPDACQWVGGCPVAMCNQPPAAAISLPCAPSVVGNEQAKPSPAPGRAAGPGTLQVVRPEAAAGRVPPPASSRLLGGRVVGYLDFGLHAVALTAGLPAGEGQQGGGGAGQPVAAGPAGAGLTTQSNIRPTDCYLILRCGKYWVATRPQSVGPSTQAGSWGGLALRIPLTHPATVLSVALFRASDSSGAARKVASVRTVISLHLVASDSLVGRLRLRASQLRAGPLHGPVTLPLLGERPQSRGPAVTATCTLSLRVTYPSPVPVVTSYLFPTTYGPLLLLQKGCVAGDDLSSPYHGHEALALEDDQVERRRRRAVFGWLGEVVSPPLNRRVARRVLEDGRHDFTLSRTAANWRRLQMVVASAKPLSDWWSKIQSWRQPWKSALVALAIVMAAVWPSRACAVGALAAAIGLLRGKATLGSAFGAPPMMVEDAALEGPLVMAPAAEDGGGLWPGGGKRLASLRSSRSAYFDPGLGPSPRNSSVAAVSAAGTVDTSAEDARNGWVDASDVVNDGTATPPLAGQQPGGLGGSNDVLPMALDVAFWGAPGAPQPQGGSSGPPTPPLIVPEASGTYSRGDGSPARSRLAASSPASNGGAAIGSAQGNAGPAPVPAANTAVPLDALGSLKAQYDGMVRFMLTVQNVLDGLAASGERLAAWGSWSDPLATGLLVLALVVVAALAWVVGMPALIAALLLFDMRPPVIRDPWPAPPLNLLGCLPTRSDHMG